MTFSQFEVDAAKLQLKLLRSLNEDVPEDVRALAEAEVNGNREYDDSSRDETHSDSDALEKTRNELIYTLDHLLDAGPSVTFHVPGQDPVTLPLSGLYASVGTRNSLHLHFPTDTPVNKIYEHLVKHGVPRLAPGKPLGTKLRHSGKHTSTR